MNGLEVNTQFKVTFNGTTLVYLGNRKEDAYEIFCSAVLNRHVTLARLDCTYRLYDGKKFTDQLRSIVWKSGE